MEINICNPYSKNNINDRSLSAMVFKVVELKLSKRLVDFSMTVASPLASSEDAHVLAFKLKQKNFIYE